MAKKIETLQTADNQSEVIKSTKQELSDLNLSIGPGKDKEKFDKLSKDSALKRGIEKILKKGLQKKIKNFENYCSKNMHGKIDGYTAQIIKAHPELITFIGGELGLPVKMDNLKSENQFAGYFTGLRTEQQLKILALYETKNYFGTNFDKVGASEIIDKYHTYMKSFIEEATEDFNNKVSDKKVLGLVNLKNLLQSEYGLTDTEYDKMAEYLKIIQEHPEYVGGDMKPIEAGTGTGILIGMGIAFVLAALGIYTYKKIFKLKEPETRIYGKSTEIKNFKEVFKIMSLETELTSNTREIEGDPLGYYDEETGGVAFRTIKKGSNIVRKIINDSGIESRKLTLQVDTEIAHVFDFEKAKGNVELKNGKGTIHVKVGEPELKIIGTDVQIFDSKREFINLDRFDDFDIKAVDTLKQEALDKANTPEVLEKAIRSLGKNILTLYHINGIATSDFCIKGDDIETVVVECAGKKITVKLSDLEK